MIEDTSDASIPKPAHERGMEEKFHGLLPGRVVIVDFQTARRTNNQVVSRPATVVITYEEGVITANVQFDEFLDQTIRLQGGQLVNAAMHTLRLIPYLAKGEQAYGQPYTWRWPDR